MKRILCISHYTSLYGANRSLLDLIEGRRERGWEIAVILPEKGKMSEELERLSIKVIDLPVPPIRVLQDELFSAGKKNIVDNIRVAMALADEIIRYRFDVLYVNSSVIGLGDYLSLLTAKPLVRHLREFGEADYDVLPISSSPIFEAMMREGSKVIAISRSIYKRYSLRPDNALVIGNAIASKEKIVQEYGARRHFLQTAPKTTVDILCIGLLHPHKGQLQILEAFAQICSIFPNVYLHFVGGVGDEPYTEAMGKFVAEHSLEEKVIYHGYQPDIWEYLKMGDIHITASEAEAFGRVTAEAMAAGLAVIGRKGSGTSEIIEHGRTGLLYEATTEDLVVQLETLLKDENLRREIGENAHREALDKFTTERLNEEIAQALGEVMETRKLPNYSPAMLSIAEAAVDGNLTSIGDLWLKMRNSPLFSPVPLLQEDYSIENFLILTRELCRGEGFEALFSGSIFVQKWKATGYHYPPIRVSAIVSCYKAEKFLRGCIDDLLEQTLWKKGLLEIIVIDSNSPENEGPIIRQYQEKVGNERLRYVRTEEREGLYAAWNRGIALAKGEFITNANADDRHRPDALEIMLAAFDEQPLRDVVYADQLITTVENDTFSGTAAARRWDWPPFSYQELERRAIIGPQPLWRKSLHRKFGFFREDFLVCGDYEFWLRIGQEAHFYKVPEILGLYFENAEGLEIGSGSRTEMENDFIRFEYGLDAKNVQYVGSVPVAVAPEELASLPYRGRADENIAVEESSTVLVSVVVPTQGKRKLQLEETLRSIMSQMHTNLEILLVNDGGESLVDFVAQLGDERIVLIELPTSQERSAARNAALARAGGDFVAYLDDDDIFYPAHCSTLLDYLKKHPDCMLAYTDANRAVYADDDFAQYGISVQERACLRSHHFDREELLIGNYIPICCVMHRREMLAATGSFDENINAHEDHDLWLRASRIFQFAHLSVVTCEYREKFDQKLSPQREKEYFLAHTYLYQKYAPLAPRGSRTRLLQEAQLKYFYSRYCNSQNVEFSEAELQKSIPNHRFPIFSIIIPVRNNWQLTAQCIESILLTQRQYCCEIIIIDNNSTDETPSQLRRLAAQHPCITVLTNGTNETYSHANNQGAAIAKGRYLIFLNNDTKALPGWLEALHREFEGSENIGVQGAKLLYEHGSIQHAGMVFGARPGRPAEPYHAYLNAHAEAPFVNKRREVQFVTGACLVVRAEIFENVGGFDEGYIYGWEDTDLCMKVRQAGYSILYNPQVVLFHFESVTKKHVEQHEGNGAFFDSLSPQEQRNRERFFERWSSTLVNDHLDFYAADGFVIEGGRLVYRPPSSPPEPKTRTSFDPIFWERKYASIRQVALIGTGALGDSLMLTAVVRCLKERHPHCQITVFGNDIMGQIFLRNPDIVAFRAEEEYRAELFETTVDYRNIIARLPEYYNGIGFMDILGNIAGVHLSKRGIVYSATPQEQEKVAELLPNEHDIIIGLHFHSSKDEARTWSRAEEWVRLLHIKYSRCKVVVFGAGHSFPEMQDCLDLSAAGLTLREQIAAVGRCDLFVSVDSAFFHVAHNLYEKPTLLLASITNPKLIGNKLLRFGIVRKENHPAIDSYWSVPDGRECLDTLAPEEVLGAMEELAEEYSIPLVVRDSALNIIASSPDGISEKIACPYCGSLEAAKVRDNADICTCRRCGTTYLRERYSAKAMEAVYQRYASRDNAHLKPPEKEEQRAASELRREYFLDYIEQFSPLRGLLFDVGCGWGAFLEAARERGYAVKGLEITELTADFAASLGLDVRREQFTDADIPSESVAVLTMLHVLEHLPAPKDALRKAYQVLEEGGLFCGIVPNFGSLSSEALRERWEWLDPFHHYVHYTPATLRRCLVEAGFEVLEISTHSGDFGETIPLEIIRQVMPDVAAEQRKEVLREVELQGRGEEIRFVAKKAAAAPASLRWNIDLPVHKEYIDTHSGDDLYRLLHLHFGRRKALMPYILAEEAPVYAKYWNGVKVLESNTPESVLRFYAPFLNYSGYASAARNVLHGLAALRDNIQAVPLPPIADQAVLELSAEGQSSWQQLMQQKEGHIEISLLEVVPSAYKFISDRPTDYRIGRPIAENAISAAWAEQCNTLDELWLANDFVADIFRSAGVTTPITIIPQGVDTDTFCPEGELFSLEIAAKTVFLAIFEWLPRKGFDYLLQAWHTAFGADDDVLLVIKTSKSLHTPEEVADIVSADIAAWAERRQVDLEKLPPLLVLTENIAEKDMPSLYRAASAFVLLSRAEGWGRPYMEAMATGLPVIATRYSGNVAFMDDETAYLVAPEYIEEIEDSATVGGKIALAVPSVEEAADYMRFIHRNRGEALEKGRKARTAIVERFSQNAVAQLAHQRLEEIIGSLRQHNKVLRQRDKNQSTFEKLTNEETNMENTITPVSGLNEADVILLTVEGSPSAGKARIIYEVGKGLPTADIQYWQERGGADSIVVFGALEFLPEDEIPAFLSVASSILSDKGTMEIEYLSLPDIAGLYARKELTDPDLVALMKGRTPTPSGYLHAFDSDDLRTLLTQEGWNVLSFEEPEYKGSELRRVSALVKINRSTFRDLGDLEHRRTITPVAEAAPKKVVSPRGGKWCNIVWEGSQFVHHSFALINREIVLALHQSGLANIAVVPYEEDKIEVRTADPRFRVIEELDIRNTPIEQTIDPSLPTVWIRHQWPTQATPPPLGKWVIIQPWEYGVFPEDMAAIFRKADEMWAPSTFSRQAFVASGIDFDKSQVVPNGINPLVFTPAGSTYPLTSRKKFKLLFVGGTIYRKGIDILLKAYKKAFTASDDIVLVIKDIGGATFYKGQTATDQIEEFKSNPNNPAIEYINADMSEQQMASLYRACNVFVSPYRGEGFSLPTLEAMACGLPVIVTAGGATDDFVDEQVGWRLSSQRTSLGNTLDGKPLAGEGYVLEVDLDETAQVLLDAYNNPSLVTRAGVAAAYRARSQWHWQRAAQKALSRIGALLEFPTDYQKAVEEALPEWSGDGALLIGEAESALYNGDIDAAIAYLQSAFEVRQMPHKFALLGLVRLASLSLNEGDFDLALEICGKVDDLQPHSPDAKYIRSTLHAIREEWQSAIDLLNPLMEDWKTARFESVLELSLDQIICDAARATFHLGEKEEALHVYELALKLNPENHEACFGAALSLFDMGEHKHAEMMADFAANLAPQFQPAQELVSLIKKINNEE